VVIDPRRLDAAASRADENPAVAAGGSGIFEHRITNNYWGLGPHAGLDLERRIGDNSGLTIVGRLDGAILLGEIEQGLL
jgi:Legionella pneumophila major outer membrane protein precursor